MIWPSLDDVYKFQLEDKVLKAVEKSIAPVIGADVLLVEVTKIAERGRFEKVKFVVPVLSVNAYNPKFDIWEVRVPLRPYDGGEDNRTVNTWVWIKKSGIDWKVVDEPAE